MTNIKETSREALRVVAPELITKELQVLRCYEEHGPMTDKEVAYQIHMPAALVSARRNSLVKRGYVVELGKRACRLTKMRVIVWGLAGPNMRLFF